MAKQIQRSEDCGGLSREWAGGGGNGGEVCDDGVSGDSSAPVKPGLPQGGIELPHFGGLLIRMGAPSFAFGYGGQAGLATVRGSAGRLGRACDRDGHATVGAAWVCGGWAFLGVGRGLR